jgi:hypothetical protein
MNAIIIERHHYTTSLLKGLSCCSFCITFKHCACAEVFICFVFTNLVKIFKNVHNFDLLWCYIKQVMNVVIRAMIKIFSWGERSSWKYFYLCTHKHSYLYSRSPTKFLIGQLQSHGNIWLTFTSRRSMILLFMWAKICR